MSGLGAGRGEAPLVIASALPGAGGGLAMAAAVAGALAGSAGVVLVELGAARRRGPTMLATGPARELERRLRAAGLEAAARGRLCWLSLAEGEDWLERLAAIRSLDPGAAVVAHLPARLWPAALAAGAPRPSAGLLRAELPSDRSLAALAVTELREREIRARVAVRPLGLVGSRRALAGVDPGGSASARCARLARGLLAPMARSAREGVEATSEAGQALLLTLGAAFCVLLVAFVLAAIGAGTTGAARIQRAADLAALSGARSLRDDLPGLLAPERLPGGAPNPAHLDRSDYLDAGRSAALEAAGHNGLDPARVHVSFPDGDSLVPVRVRVEVAAELEAPGSQRVDVQAAAEAQASPPAGWSGTGTLATGGGYAGPLAYRQGKPMRPDVAVAFDRMTAAARADGIDLVINSAFRSDAEQARLFAQNPDPRWVAPPGQSLHRCATELDLGPPGAYGWLAANAGRFAFVRRYAWEPWHFGYDGGPAPCSAAGDAIGTGEGDGRAAGAGGLPGFVPAAFRADVLGAAARWDVSAGLLAAQLMAESGFDPHAVSPVGAQGIAQFMPATATAYGLGDPFDARRAIDAQAHLMADLLTRFGSVPLALAAYNAGPGAVEACDCVPPYPETQAYVARIVGLMGAAGEIEAPTLEVRLVG